MLIVLVAVRTIQVELFLIAEDDFAPFGCPMDSFGSPLKPGLNMYLFKHWAAFPLLVF
jgi:hypothetical protein